MASDTLFPLLLPVYAGDSADFLRLAFESSVGEQTLSPAEVVIRQDGSVPEALAAELTCIESDSPVPVTIVRLVENIGLTVALNASLAACTHPVVARRMDADDVLWPERFAKQWALMAEGYGLVGTGMSEFETDAGAVSAERIPPVGQ